MTIPHLSSSSFQQQQKRCPKTQETKATFRLQHFSQDKTANYSLINLNTSRQVTLSDNTSKHYLSRVTLACFTKTLERRFTLLCFTTYQLFCILLEIHDYYNLLHFHNYTLFEGFLQTTLTLDDIFYSARQQSITTKIYFKNVLCLLSFQIHNVFENNRQTRLINLHYKPDDNVLDKM